jgi:hypothetical protein
MPGSCRSGSTVCSAAIRWDLTSRISRRSLSPGALIRATCAVTRGVTTRICSVRAETKRPARGRALCIRQNASLNSLCVVAQMRSQRDLDQAARACQVPGLQIRRRRPGLLPSGQWYRSIGGLRRLYWRLGKQPRGPARGDRTRPHQSDEYAQSTQSSAPSGQRGLGVSSTGVGGSPGELSD